MENIIQNILEFIENNHWMVASFVVIIINIAIIIFTILTKKLYKKRINLLYEDYDDQKSIFEQQISELKQKQSQKELSHNEELKKPRTEFEEKVKFANLVFQEELEKRSHFTQATIDKLRLQIKDLKDNRRKLAITNAQGLTNDDGAVLTGDELVEAAEKIYKFYLGK
jgi:hypothetical protein